MTPVVEVVVTFLEMTEPPARVVRPMSSGAVVEQARPDTAPAMAAEMYRKVGGAWHWRDRLDWTDEEWRSAIGRPGVEIWTVRVHGEVAGFYELAEDGDVVDIRYFGLMPAWTGRGLGGPVLEHAIRRAWSLGPGRVTVNTCTLDHPAALPNYRARGFAVVRTERQRRRIP